MHASDDRNFKSVAISSVAPSSSRVTTPAAVRCTSDHACRPIQLTKSGRGPWPRRATLWFPTRVSVGRTNYVLKTLQ